MIPDRPDATSVGPSVRQSLASAHVGPLARPYCGSVYEQPNPSSGCPIFVFELTTAAFVVVKLVVVGSKDQQAGSATMTEPDELYTLRAQYWLGHYQLAVEEAKAIARRPMNPNLKLEREEYLNRSYIALGQYDKLTGGSPGT